MNIKSTGITRKVDDLGRVVIPKEIRKVFGLEDGSTLEIYTEGNRLIFEKYKPNLEKEEVVKELEAMIKYSINQGDKEALERAINLIK